MPVYALLLAAATFANVAGAHPDLDVLLHTHERESARRADEPAVHLEEAHVRRLAHDFDAALLAAERARALGADPADVAVVRARVHLDAGWPGAARAELDRALAARPERAHVRLFRAEAARRLGDLDAAAADYRAAIGAMASPSPDHVIAHRDVLLEAGDPSGALAALDLGIRRIGPVPSLQLPAVDLALALGRPQDALRRLDVLLAQSPRNEAWLARRGEVLERAGRPEEARRTWRSALALIESRPAGRRGGRVRALETQLRARLAVATQQEEEEKP